MRPCHLLSLGPIPPHRQAQIVPIHLHHQPRISKRLRASRESPLQKANRQVAAQYFVAFAPYGSRGRFWRRAPLYKLGFSGHACEFR